MNRVVNVLGWVGTAAVIIAVALRFQTAKPEWAQYSWYAAVAGLVLSTLLVPLGIGAHLERWGVPASRISSGAPVASAAWRASARSPDGSMRWKCNPGPVRTGRCLSGQAA